MTAATIRLSLELAACLSAQAVALAAIGTGYGRQTMADFAKAFRVVMGDDFPPIERVVIGLRSPDDVEALWQLRGQSRRRWEKPIRSEYQIQKASFP